jgi:mannose-6-phosphate isomerase-like protein (cupin superfamily)
MSGYAVDIEAKTLENENFREVLFTARHSQLVVMTLKPGEEIGLEHHDGHDQFIRVEAGQGEAIIDGERHALRDGSAIYSPPEHPHGTVHRSKQEADEYERAHHHA